MIEIYQMVHGEMTAVKEIFPLPLQKLYDLWTCNEAVDSRKQNKKKTPYLHKSD